MIHLSFLGQYLYEYKNDLKIMLSREIHDGEIEEEIREAFRQELASCNKDQVLETKLFF
jgi:hypothetical protein